MDSVNRYSDIIPMKGYEKEIKRHQEAVNMHISNKYYKSQLRGSKNYTQGVIT